MEPTLLVGDRIFVTKYSYGYSKHSFPFSPPILKKRIVFTEPERGDVVVFKTPADNRTDYVKRLIGLPGDRIQFIDSNLYINNNEIPKSRLSKNDKIYCGNRTIDVFTYKEKLPNSKSHASVYLKDFPYRPLLSCHHIYLLKELINQIEIIFLFFLHLKHHHW